MPFFLLINEKSASDVHLIAGNYSQMWCMGTWLCGVSLTFVCISITIFNSKKLLIIATCHTNNDKNRLFRIITPDVEINAICPDLNIALFREVPCSQIIITFYSFDIWYQEVWPEVNAFPSSVMGRWSFDINRAYQTLFQTSNRYEPENLSYPYNWAETLPVNSERPS